LEKIVIIDNSILSFYLQINNGIPIFPFYEDKNDNELRVLVNYLKHLKKFEDVRKENKAILKLDYIYKDLESQCDFSSASSVENESNINNNNNGNNFNEFFYDSEINENILNICFKEKNCANKDNDKSNNNANNNTNDIHNLEIEEKCENYKTENVLYSPTFNRNNILNKFNIDNENNNDNNLNVNNRKYNPESIANNSFSIYNTIDNNSKIFNKLKQKFINIEIENKDFSSFYSLSNNNNQSNLNLNFSFGCKSKSGKKEYFSNKSNFSNKSLSGISNKSNIKEKLYICLEDLHCKFTDFCRKEKLINE